jgi:hypothetical protein
MIRLESPSRPHIPLFFATTAVLVGQLLLLIRPPVAGANWPFNSNVNVPLCTSSFDQLRPLSVTDGNGGAIVAWSDYRNAGGGVTGAGADIYAEHVFASGIVDGTWPADGRAICTATGDQLPYGIVSDGAGGAIVLWFDRRNGSTADLYGQRINAGGTPQWTADGVAVCTAPQNQGNATIVPDGSGGAIVAWQDFRNGTNWHIYAQRVNATGAAQWTADGAPVCTAPGSQVFPTLVMDAAGGAIITWADGRTIVNSSDIYAQRIDAAGLPQWTADGVALCTEPYAQAFPAIAPDGAGGAIVAWHDFRSNANNDIYSQRVSAAGVPKWLGNGVKVCGAANGQSNPTIVSDGSGGAIITWDDLRNGNSYDIYAQRVNSSGAALWTADGVGLCTACAADQNGFGNQVLSDGAGGAIVAWDDFRNGVSRDIYAQRVLASGLIPSSWPLNGRALCTALRDQLYPTVATDGGSRAIVAWQDYRAGFSFDIYAQLVSPSGFLAVPNPNLHPIADLPWDQGGFVNVRWDASYLDTDEPYVVDHYWVLRSAPSSAITSAVAEGRVLTPEQFGAASDAVRVNAAAAAAAGEAAPNALVVTVTGADSYYWEPIKRIDALHAVAGYSYVAPTTSDSTAGGNPLTAFMVIAYDPSGTIYLPSDPDSGYSVDNLPPGTPGHLAGNYTAGATHLHWDPNVDRDLANYRVYRGSSASFVPGTGNLVGSPPDTGFSDVGAAGSYYKLSAMDIHGNESPFALLSPSGTTDVQGVPTLTLSLARPVPNPAHRAARLGFALPHEARVSLAIYDVAGRQVRAILESVLPAGEHTLSWDLRDEAGSTAHAGLYFVRLEAEGRWLTQRLVVSGD